MGGGKKRERARRKEGEKESRDVESRDGAGLSKCYRGGFVEDESEGGLEGKKNQERPDIKEV